MGVFDIALKIKAKNGVLQDFIDKKGWTQSELARQINVDVQAVCRWFNMRDYPHNPQIMLKLAELLDKPPEEIFPDFLRDKDWLTGAREWTVYKEIDLEMLPYHQMRALAAPEIDMDRGIQREELKKEIMRALSTLTPREEKIIKMRMGIDNYTDYTLDEIGKKFGLTKTRIREIEQRALRKLRHPTRRLGQEVT